MGVASGCGSKEVYTGVGNWRNCRPKLTTVAAWIRHEQSFFPPDQRHL